MRRQINIQTTAQLSTDLELVRCTLAAAQQPHTITDAIKYAVGLCADAFQSGHHPADLRRIVRANRPDLAEIARLLAKLHGDPWPDA